MSSSERNASPLSSRFRLLPIRHETRPRQRRIAVVAETFLPAMNGVTNSVMRLVSYAKARGDEICVIAPGPGPTSHDGVQVTRIPSFGLPGYAELRVGIPSPVVSRALRDFAPDVVHLAAPTVLGASGAIAARRLGIPTVAVFQTDVAGFARRYGWGACTRPIWAWMRYVHNVADCTLAPSSSTSWALRERGIERVGLWGRGVDLDLFDPRRRDLTLWSQCSPPSGSRPIIVGYVGRLAAEKQVERLTALAALPGTQLVIAGDGPLRKRLERLLPNAHFAGFLRGADLARVYASLDVFVHTGLDETFCQTIQEALASGVPVVAPACGGPLDLVRHLDNGLLWSPHDPLSLPGAVHELVRNHPMRLAMSNRARASVIERSWDSVFSELYGWYDRVCADDPLSAVA